MGRGGGQEKGVRRVMMLTGQFPRASDVYAFVGDVGSDCMLALCVVSDSK